MKFPEPNLVEISTMEKFPHAHISANGNLTPSYREGGTIPQSVCFPRNL